jgi:hypothetical protein
MPFLPLRRKIIFPGEKGLNLTDGSIGFPPKELRESLEPTIYRPETFDFPAPVAHNKL